MFTQSLIMQNAEARKINVFALFASYRDSEVQRRITPYSFTTEEGNQFEISTIRRVYQDRVGGAYHIHFVVKTRCDRYFDILYDTKKVMWSLVVEIEDYIVFEKEA